MNVKNTWNTGDSFAASDENAIATQVNTTTTNIAAAYVKPSGGIPESDDAPAVQSSINAATRLLNDEYIPSSVVTLSRVSANAGVSTTSGTVYLMYLTADKAITLNNLVSTTSGTAAAATPSICRMGIYSIDGSGNLTLIGATTNDTTLWSAVNTTYTKALAAATSLTQGTRYALGLLVVTTVATPTIIGETVIAAEGAVAPRISGAVTGQTDLPTSVAVANIVTSGTYLYMRGF